MQNEFKETRILFYNSIPYKVDEPLSYEQWLEVADEYKSAVIYLQFYDQITLAWEKVKSFYTPTSDGVSILLQYIEKNVEKIKSDRNRFSPAYIYKIAFNSLYCECHDRVSTRKAFDNEISEQSMITNSDGDSVSYFDKYAGDVTTIESQISDAKKDALKIEFWKMIERLGVSDYCIIQKLANIPSAVILEDIKKLEGYSEYISQQKGDKITLPKLSSKRKLEAIDKLNTIFNAYPEFAHIASDYTFSI